MELHTGSDRRVICGKKYTVKIARASPKGFLEYGTYIYRQKGLKYLFGVWDRESTNSCSGLKWNLLHGVVANRREERLARNYKLFVPTRSFLAGVLNLQPTTNAVGAKKEELMRTFVKNLQNSSYEVAHLDHIFEDAGNFGVHEGAVKFRDGGSTGLERMLTSEVGTHSVEKALGALTSAFLDQ